MAEWVANSFWGGYIADLGPYIGPLPSAPPIPANLPGVAGEIDYVIGVPDPGNTTGFLNGNCVDLFRYWKGAAGASATTTGLQVFGDGATGAPLHLMVLWFNPTFQSPGSYPPPAVVPATLVPPSFVAGASGARVGNPKNGHWSDWLSPAALAGAAIQTGAAASYTDTAATLAPRPGSDVRGLEQDQMTALYASAPVHSPGNGIATFAMSVELQAAGDGSLTSSIMTGAGAFPRQMAQLVGSAPVVPSGVLEFPYDPAAAAVAADLIEGIDYWQIAEGTYEQFEQPPSSTFVEWASAILNYTAEWQSYSDSHNTAAQMLAYQDLDWDIRIVPTSEVGTMAQWVADNAGISVGGFVTGPADDQSFGVIVTGTVPLATSGYGASGWNLVVFPRGMSVLAGPINDFPAPPPADLAESYMVTWGMSGVSLTMTPLIQYPTFRYWIPGLSEPSYLRMGQRNDGRGLHGHPRIPIGPNAPSSVQSVQAGAAPRIGTRNRYQ